MTTIICRGIFIDIDNDILKYFPFIENILKYKDKFATKFENNALKLNFDPIIMNELVNFYVMPHYHISENNISNVKELAKYMGSEILTTMITKEKTIDNVYKINKIGMTINYSDTIHNGSYPTNNLLRKCVDLDVNGETIECVFDGLPENPLNYTYVEGIHTAYYSYKSHTIYKGKIHYLTDNESLKILNSMLFNDTIKIVSSHEFNIVYEKIIK